MSTYSLTVTGPSTGWVMLRALATKLLTHTQHVWTTIRVTFSRAARVAKAGATTALAVIGSNAGYQLARHTTRTLTTTTARLTSAGVGVVHRALGAVGRAVLAGIGLISPTAADVVAELTSTFITEPVTQLLAGVTGWVREAGALLWELSDMPVVRSVTTRAAQVASIVVGVHAVTKGAAAAAIVQAMPWAMDAIVVVTNPAWALLGVTAAFVGAVVFAATRITSRNPEPTPGPVTARPAPVTELPTPAVDLRDIAAKLNVEVTPDGSVVVHGIPDTLPEHVGLQVAHIAADAAATRLQRILLHRRELTRDDRRVLTKVAREAVRVQRRLLVA